MNYIRINKGDLWVTAAVEAGLFLLVHIVTILALLITREQSSVLLGGTLLPIAGAIILLVLTGTAVLNHFDYLITFGCTRKRALANVLGYLGALSGVLLVLSWGLSALERAVFPSLWKAVLGVSQIRMESLMVPEGSLPPSDILFVEDMSLSWWWAPLILLAGIVIGLVGGAVIHRFGKRGGWCLWAVYMAVCLVAPSWLERISTSMAATVCILAIITLVLGLIWAVWDLLRGPIRR